MEKKMQLNIHTKKMQLNIHTKQPNNIPNDVIIEILSLLPAKSLLRLKWVCKYWFDLITDKVHGDSFIKMHLHRSITSSSVLSFCFMNVWDSYKRLSKQGLSQGHYYLNETTHVVSNEVNQFMPEHIQGILGSSNGLLLLMTNKDFYILNPCTKEYRILPRPFYNKRDYNINLMVMENNRNLVVMEDTYGFGYDQTIDDYKVIRIRFYIYDDCLDVQVYTLGTDSWRWINNDFQSSFPYRLQDCRSSPGVFLNGALYWMDYSHKNIVSFDIEKEIFRYVSRTPNLPSAEVRGLQRLLTANADYLHKLQVFERSLCLVMKVDQYDDSAVEIWLMKDYTVNNDNDSLLWTKLLTVPHCDYFPIKPLRYAKNGEILMLNSHKDLILYDPKHTSYLTLGRIWEDCNQFSVLEVYTESLVSLNSGIYVDRESIRKQYAKAKAKEDAMMLAWKKRSLLN